ncbi:hypothetical protein D3C75_823000 [compost metagenome]
MGLPARAWDPYSGCGCRRAGVGVRAVGYTVLRHLLCDDHTGVGTDDVFRLPAISVHRRGGRFTRCAAQAVIWVYRPQQRRASVLRGVCHLRFWLLVDPSRYPISFWPDSQSHSRKRVEGDFPGLSGSPIQIVGLRSFGCSGGARWRYQSRGVSVRDLERRPLADLGRSGADDTARRPGHRLRPIDRGRHRCDSAERIGR